VVATLVLCVVEPQSTGIGGDCFALLSKAGAVPPIAYNGSGRSPARLSAAAYLALEESAIAATSVHSITVPGLVESVARLLADHGTWSLARALEPAIEYAERGFAVHQKVAFEWATVEDRLKAAAAAPYLPGGRAPLPGEVICLPALAKTLGRIAEGGVDEFYAGETAERMLRFLGAAGGLHRAPDFADHRGDYTDAVAAPYRGHLVWQHPPNGQGVTALLMLGILEAAEFGGEPPEGLRHHHLLARATQLAFAERNRRIGDPAHGEIDIGVFLDKHAARRLAETMDAVPGEPAPTGIRARGDTAYVAVVDRDRNAVSMISSLFDNFGSGLVDPDSGVAFHSRGAGFVLDEGHPNCLAPSRRPLHTIMPGMMSGDAGVTAAFGVTGGSFQPIGHCRVVSAMLDRGLDIQAAIDEPRTFFHDGIVEFEPGLAAVAAGLRDLGHRVQPADQAVGGAHGVTIDRATGVLTAGSDARKDGCAIAV
jgi:gamma-glutamyltranspeptidase/glutathione hydrolase